MLGTLLLLLACVALAASTLFQCAVARARHREMIRTVAEIYSDDGKNDPARGRSGMT